MITGHVVNRQALLPVVFRRPEGADLSIEFVVDTGFTDFLTLPASVVAAMQLPFLYLTPADLADGSTVDLAVHRAIIVWNGAEWEVPVIATGKRPLAGTSLLNGCELKVQFAKGGLVTVNPL